MQPRASLTKSTCKFYSVLNSDHKINFEALPPANIAEIVSTYATHGKPPPKLFEQIGDAICDRNNLRSFGPSHLTEIIRSYASLNQRHSAMFQKIGGHICASLGLGMRKFPLGDLVTILSAFTKLDEPHLTLSTKIADATLEVQDRRFAMLTSDELSSIVCSYATQHERKYPSWNTINYKRLFKKVGDALAFRDLEKCNTSSMTDVLWAYATTGLNHTALFQKIGDTMITRADFDLFHQPTVLWAYSSLDQSHPVLSHSKRLLCNDDYLATVNTSDLVNILWPCTSHNYDIDMFLKVGDVMATRSDLVHLDLQSFLNIVSAYTTSNTSHPVLFQVIGDTITSSSALFSADPAILSKIIWVYAASNEHHPKLLKCISDVFFGLEKAALDERHQMTMLWAHAVAYSKDQYVFDEIKQSITNEKTQYSNFLKKLGDVLIELNELSMLSSRYLMSLVWSLSAANINNAPLFQTAADLVVSRDDLDTFSTASLANAVWAFANLSIDHSDLFRKAGDVLASRADMSTWSYEELRNIVCAYSILDETHDELFERVGGCMEQCLGSNTFTPTLSDLLDVTFAFSNSNVIRPHLFRAIGDQISSGALLCHDDLEELNPHVLDILHAYSKADAYSHSSLYCKLAASNPRVFDYFIVKRSRDMCSSPRSMLALLWGYAVNVDKTGISRKDQLDLIKRIGDSAVAYHRDNNVMAQLSVDDLSKVLCAYNMLKARHSTLFQLIGDVLANSDKISTLTREQIQNIVMAYIETNELHPKLFERFVECIDDLGGLHTFAGAPYVARAFVIQNVDIHIEFDENEVRNLDRSKLRCFHLFHLWQVGEKNKPGLPECIQELCKDAFIASDSNHECSNFHMQINSVLDSLGLKYDNEFRSESGYSIDIKVEMPNSIGRDSIVYIEADGPFHYVNENSYDATFNIDEGKEPNFSTMLKRRLVPAIDKVPLIPIPHFEWSALNRSVGLKKNQQYLRELLCLNEC